MESRNRKHFYASIYRSILYNQYGALRPSDLCQVSQSSRNLIQRLKNWNTLDGHTGCVNTVAWNNNGYLLLTGSDDCLLNLYDIFSSKLLHSITSGHHANIFSAKFVPCTSDTKIVSCSGDGMLHYNELGFDCGQNYYNCHSGTAYEVVVTPGDPNSFLSCSEDGTVRVYDLRTKTKCHCQECNEDILIDCRHPVTSISVNPLLPYHLAVGCRDSYVRVFDRRTLGTSTNTRSVSRSRTWMPGLFCKFRPENFKSDASCRVTSLNYRKLSNYTFTLDSTWRGGTFTSSFSNDGKDLLVSYCTDYVYSFTVQDKHGRIMDLTIDEKNLSRHCTSDCSDDDKAPVPAKRLRLRGDWTDTGPGARPETEQSAGTDDSLLQRMSVLFSRYLEDAIHGGLRADSTSTESSQHSADQEPPGGLNMSRLSSRQNSQNDFDSDASGRGSPQHMLSEDVENDSENLFADFVCDRNLNLERSCDDIRLFPDAVQNTGNAKLSNVTVDGDGTMLEDTEVQCNNACPVDVTVCCEPKRRLAATPEKKNAVGTPDTCDVDLNDETPLLNAVHSRNSHLAKPTSQNVNFFGSSDAISTSQDVSSAGCKTTNRTQALNEAVDNRTSSRSTHQLNREIAASKIQRFLRSYKQDHCAKPGCLYLPNASMVFKGHRNSKTMIKEANFWGDSFVLSGSDCGRIFIWDRHTGELIMVLQGDEHVVNCVQPHPHDPILATSGIDHDVKIWAPLSEEPADLTGLEEIVKRNEKMLQESRDTITVPASFLLRMLTSFGSLRNRGFARQRSLHEEVQIDENES